jgi:hypothetical protein
MLSVGVSPFDSIAPSKRAGGRPVVGSTRPRRHRRDTAPTAAQFRPLAAGRESRDSAVAPARERGAARAGVRRCAPMIAVALAGPKLAPIVPLLWAPGGGRPASPHDDMIAAWRRQPAQTRRASDEASLQSVQCMPLYGIVCLVCKHFAQHALNLHSSLTANSTL